MKSKFEFFQQGNIQNCIPASSDRAGTKSLNQNFIDQKCPLGGRYIKFQSTENGKIFLSREYYNIKEKYGGEKASGVII